MQTSIVASPRFPLFSFSKLLLKYLLLTLLVILITEHLKHCTYEESVQHTLTIQYNAKWYAETQAPSRFISPSEASWDDSDNWHCHAELSGSQGLCMEDHIM